MEWYRDPFVGVALEGFAPGEFDEIYGANMQLWRPDVPDGAEYFRLVKLRLDTSGTMGMHVYLTDEDGAPLPGVAVVQGWMDGPELPSDSIPNGGDPRGRPNRGNAFFTDAVGQAEWIWGAGEGHDPAQTEGAHWYWVPAGPSGLYSDVVYGFGWRWGTEHYKVAAYFQRVAYEPPADDTYFGILADLCDDLSIAFCETADRLRALDG